jgi:Alpha galactosidase A/Alpha galactosidase C-terminal beta sandwich domain/Carbohydrate binding module (family 6)
MVNRRVMNLLAGTGALLLGCLLVPTNAGAAATGGAATPYLGWSSWSAFRCDIDDQTIRAQALAMHDQLQSHGYRYINIDSDCANVVDGYGRKIYDPAKFTSGIGPLADYVHSLGLKLGVYTTPGIPIPAVEANTPIYGTPYHAQDIVYPPEAGHPGNDLCQYGNTFQNTCRIDYSKPGATEYIDSSADLFASSGVDLLKLDAVSPGSSTNQYDARPDVHAWSSALAQSGRTIQLILSWHLDRDYAPFWQANANGWRIDDDIECYNTCPTLTTWSNPFGYTRDTILSRYFDAAPWAAYAGPGGWSNLDSLDIGNGAADGLSDVERRSAMTLWAIAGAPIYSGDDLTKLDDTGRALLSNDRVLAVDQGGVGHLVGATNPFHDWSDQQVWAAHEADGSYAVALFNLADVPEPVTADWHQLGFCGRANVTDVWSGDGLGRHRDAYSQVLPAHGSALLRVRQFSSTNCPPAPAPEPSTFYEAEDSANTITGPASVSGCGGCSGGQKVGNLYNGAAVQFNDVRIARGGAYALTIHYAADDERTGYVSVNGGPEQLIGYFPRTGSWDTVGTYRMLVQLHAGTNTIKYLTHEGPGDFPGPRTYSPDIDGIAISPA